MGYLKTYQHGRDEPVQEDYSQSSHLSGDFHVRFLRFVLQIVQHDLCFKGRTLSTRYYLKRMVKKLNLTILSHTKMET